MKTRIVTGAVMGTVFLGALLWNNGAWVSLIFILALISLNELYKMGGISTWSPLSLIGYLATLGIIVARVDIYTVFVVAFLAAVLVSLRNQKTYSIEKIALFFFGLYYIVVGFQTSVMWYESLGKQFVLYLVILIWISDSAAYFTGYFFGKHKMAPILSPKKTMEGLIGGMVATVVFAFLMNNWMNLHMTAGLSIMTGLFVSVVAPVGDLFQSSIKRHYDIKDSGTLLPGHGGILDRFDAFLFVMLAYQFFALFL